MWIEKHGNMNRIQPKKSPVILQTEILSRAHFVKTNFNSKLFQGWGVVFDPELLLVVEPSARKNISWWEVVEDRDENRVLSPIVL